MPVSAKGCFIVLDGPEGGGKTTQIAKLHSWLEKKGISPLVTKEPGDSVVFREQIRRILLSPENDRTSKRAELLLFLADRAQHLEDSVLPALNANRVVLCDRFESSTFAYQCVARDACTREEFAALTRFANPKDLIPNWTFWLDISPETGLARNIKKRGNDRFEQEDIDFHCRVGKGFVQYFTEFYRSQFAYINAGENPDTVFKKITTHIETTGILSYIHSLPK